MTITTGVAMERMTECPLCKGEGSRWGAGGCPICVNGLVKQRNLDRSREDTAGSLALLRFCELLVAPVKRRRERTRQQRAWLEANDQPSRLDRADWDDRIRKDEE